MVIIARGDMFEEHEEAVELQLQKLLDARTKAFLQNQMMEDTRNYLIRGRRFADLADEHLKNEWVRASEVLVDLQTAAHAREWGDLMAELGLREIEPPCEEINAEHRALAAKKVKRSEHDNPGLQAAIAKCSEEQRKPKN
jgi:hypothetical protein